MEYQIILCLAIGKHLNGDDVVKNDVRQKKRNKNIPKYVLRDKNALCSPQPVGYDA